MNTSVKALSLHDGAALGAAIAAALRTVLLSNTTLTSLSLGNNDIIAHGAAGIFLGALAGPDDDAEAGGGRNVDNPQMPSPLSGGQQRCAVTTLELIECADLIAADAAALGRSLARGARLEKIHFVGIACGDQFALEIGNALVAAGPASNLRQLELLRPTEDIDSAGALPRSRSCLAACLIVDSIFSQHCCQNN